MTRAAAVSENRRHFRVSYPSFLRPRLELEEQLHEVVDLCEKGIRFCVNQDKEPLQVGAEFKAHLRLRRGWSVPVSGTVLRVAKRQIAARFEVGPPYRAILEEQRFLLGHQPHLCA